MNTTPGEEVVLKQDVLGRVKTPKARREQLLDEFERSGLTGLKFAALVGIKYQTFATWAQQRRRQRGDYAAGKLTAAKKSVQWLEAVCWHRRQVRWLKRGPCFGAAFARWGTRGDQRWEAG